ncbi:glycosyltransferase family protein [Paracoccus sp. (in: a-proteobacteria)]|uniref:glycosyltransferase family protein n=1 Tax=Paracoccus sp. TaxID=267 RepID=UPI003A877698
MVVGPSVGLKGRQRLLRAFRPDVIVLQQCRHPLNRLELVPGAPVVLDIDDADFLDPRLTPILEKTAREAAGVICGSRYIHQWARRFSNNTSVVWTGTPMPTGTRRSHDMRQPVVTWAQATPLKYENEMAFCRDVMLKVVERRPGGVMLRLYGCKDQPNHPMLAELRRAGVRLELLGFLPYDQFLSSLEDVAVGLSVVYPQGFSLGKSFGKILGYLDAQVPVICSDAVDHGLFFTEGSGVVSNDPDLWADQICDLLDNPERREAMARLASEQLKRRLSTPVAADLVGRFLGKVVMREKAVQPDAAVQPQRSGQVAASPMGK